MQNKSPIQKAITNNPSTPQTLQQYIKRMQTEITRALPSAHSPERFTRIVLSALSSNPRLAECSPQSFLGAMMTAAQLGLEPNTPLGQAYLIPYYNKKHSIYECVFVLGYKGLIDLAYRGGEVNVIQSHLVYEHDEFDFCFGLEPRLVHRPIQTDRGALRFVYALFKAKNGGYGFDVMSADEIRTHKERYAQNIEGGAWATHFEEMAKKVVLKRVLKYAPLRGDTTQAIASDETIRQGIADSALDLDEQLEGLEYLSDEVAA